MIAFSLNEEQNYVVISFSGTPTLDDYVSAVDSLKRHQGFHPETHRICDFSNADLDVTSEEIVTFTEEVKTLPLEKATKTAFVTSDDRERQIISSFGQYIDRGEFRIFETGEDALGWVMRSPNPQALALRARVRVHRLMGDVTPKDVLLMQNAWFAGEDFDADAPILWDLRKARLHVEIEQLSRIAEKMIEKGWALRPDARTALLVGSGFHKAILASGFSKSVEVGKLQVFQSEADAYEFLLPELGATT